MTNPPPFILSVPLMVEAVPKFTPPAISTSLKPTVLDTVPVPEKENLPAPVPDAKAPEVLATKPPLLMVTVFALPTVSVPDVRFKVPMVVLPPRVTPPDPLTVKVETVPLNREAGKVTPVVLVKATTPDALLASMFPLVLEMDEPE